MLRRLGELGLDAATRYLVLAVRVARQLANGTRGALPQAVTDLAASAAPVAIAVFFRNFRRDVRFMACPLLWEIRLPAISVLVGDGGRSVIVYCPLIRTIFHVVKIRVSSDGTACAATSAGGGLLTAKDGGAAAVAKTRRTSTF